MAAAFFWRDKLFDLIAEKNYTNLIIILYRRKGQHRTQLCSQILLLLRDGTEVFRATHIHQQHYSQLTFFIKHLYVGMVKTRGNVPVDGPDLVAQLVFANL